MGRQGGAQGQRAGSGREGGTSDRCVTSRPSGAPFGPTVCRLYVIKTSVSMMLMLELLLLLLFKTNVEIMIQLCI